MTDHEKQVIAMQYRQIHNLLESLISRYEISGDLQTGEQLREIKKQLKDIQRVE